MPKVILIPEARKQEIIEMYKDGKPFKIIKSVLSATDSEIKISLKGIPRRTSRKQKRLTAQDAANGLISLADSRGFFDEMLYARTFII